MSIRLSRRGLILGATAAGAVVAVGSTPSLQWRLKNWWRGPKPVPFDPNVFLSIAPDDTVTLMVSDPFGASGTDTVVITVLDPNVTVVSYGISEITSSRRQICKAPLRKSALSASAVTR